MASRRFTMIRSKILPACVSIQRALHDRWFLGRRLAWAWQQGKHLPFQHAGTTPTTQAHACTPARRVVRVLVNGDCDSGGWYSVRPQAAVGSLILLPWLPPKFLSWCGWYNCSCLGVVVAELVVKHTGDGGSTIRRHEWS
ncbi:unnamed protein product, partial [Trichogramma brassicae]